MSSATFIALLVFSFVSSITPGPNNIMLFASGVNFGIKRTIPHALGIAFGFAALLTAVGLGVGVLLETLPALMLLLKVAGGAYMLYLAWRIATTNSIQSSPTSDAANSARPMTFPEAALFQWVNPKAWVMAITAMAVYTAEGDYMTNVAIVVFSFTLVNFPSVSVWAGCGHLLRQWLSDPVRLKWFNLSMALALVISLWPLLLT